MTAPPPSDWIGKAELFQKLDARAVEALVKNASTRTIPPGTDLLKQGDPPSHLFLVINGRIKMSTVTPDGAQKALRFMNPGDLIGCAAVFGGFPYPATATATASSTVLAWTSGRFDELLRQYPQLASNSLALVGGRAGEMLKRVQQARTATVEQRIARALTTLAQDAEFGALDISRQELAEFSDTTLFSVSRVVSAWKRAGIVEAGRGRILVVDQNRLQKMAYEGPSQALAGPPKG